MTTSPAAPAQRPVTATSTTPSTYSDDAFGAGVFDEPPRAPVRRAPAPQREPEPAPPKPAAPVRQEEEDDGFGAGLV